MKFDGASSFRVNIDTNPQNLYYLLVMITMYLQEAELR
jgi:hypothetical protein